MPVGRRAVPDVGVGGRDGEGEEPRAPFRILYHPSVHPPKRKAAPAFHAGNAGFLFLDIDQADLHEVRITNGLIISHDLRGQWFRKALISSLLFMPERPLMPISFAF